MQARIFQCGGRLQREALQQSLVFRVEIAEMLVSDLPPKPKDAALVYGYYMGSYGKPYKYYEARGIREGTFKGRDLQKPMPGLRTYLLRSRTFLSGLRRRMRSGQV